MSISQNPVHGAVSKHDETREQRKRNERIETNDQGNLRQGCFAPQRGCLHPLIVSFRSVRFGSLAGVATARRGQSTSEEKGAAYTSPPCWAKEANVLTISVANDFSHFCVLPMFSRSRGRPPVAPSLQAVTPTLIGRTAAARRSGERAHLHEVRHPDAAMPSPKSAGRRSHTSTAQATLHGSFKPAWPAATQAL